MQVHVLELAGEDARQQFLPCVLDDGDQREFVGDLVLAEGLEEGVGAKAGENLLGVEVGGSCIICIVADNSNVLPC